MGLNINYGPDFEKFWKAYPRKVNKGQAYRAFQKLQLSSEDVDELVLHLEQRKRDDAKWVEGKFIPHAASFLNGHRWLDEYERVKRHWTEVRPPEEPRQPRQPPTDEEIARVDSMLKEATRGLPRVH